MFKEEEKIVDLLSEIIFFLQTYKSFHWAKMLQRDLDEYQELLLQTDSSNIDEKVTVLARIGSYYGGMGSFNDVPLIIDDEAQEFEIDEKYQKMKSGLYKLICDLRYLYKGHKDKEGNADGPIQYLL